MSGTHTEQTFKAQVGGAPGAGFDSREAPHPSDSGTLTEHKLGTSGVDKATEPNSSLLQYRYRASEGGACDA